MRAREMDGGMGSFFEEVTVGSAAAGSRKVGHSEVVDV